MNAEPVAASPSPGSASPFEHCLVTGDAIRESDARRRRRKALGISLLIEGALLGLVIFVPLVTSVAQPRLTRVEYFPFVPGAPHRARVDAKPEPPVTRPGIRNLDLTYPTPLAPRRPLPTVEVDPGDVRPIGDGPIESLGGDAPIPWNLQPLTAALPPPAESKNKSDRRPLKLSEPVVQAQLISRVEPRYPPLGVQMHLQGTVILHAIISREGTITSLVVVGGHPLLVEAALDAVRQWRYRPTILDGEPVEVDTTISVVFQLQN